MPKYDYKCSDCNHIEEIFQRLSEEKLTICPKCNKETFDKVFLPASVKNTGIKLKGSGWTGKILK